MDQVQWDERSRPNLDIAQPEFYDRGTVEKNQAGDAGWIVTHGHFTFENR